MSRTVVTFDGHELTASYVVSNLRTSLLPRSITTRDVPGMDGLALTGVKLAARTITLTLTTTEKDIEDRQEAARSLAAALAVDGPRSLSISIDGGVYFMAVPTSNNDATRYVNATSFDVAFECQDPVGYGEEQTVTVPSGGTATFTVGGTYPTMPAVSAPTAGGSDGTWRLALDDGSFLYADIPNGHASAAVMADCASRVLKVDGVVTLLIPEADWMVLDPGEHTLTMTGTGAATVTYRERWL